MQNSTSQLSHEIPLNILIVEDSVTSQLVAQEFLENFGYQPDIVSNGQEAIDAMNKKNYDLIFMDEHMPIMNGLETTEYIRKNFGNKPIIIAMTGSDLEEDRQKYITSGMNHCISKPLTEDSVRKAISLCQKNYEPSSNDVSSEISNYETKILNAFNDNKRIVNLFITSFLKDVDLQISDIEKSIQTKNLTQMQESAHKLKGSASYCGNEQLNAILRELTSTRDFTRASALFLECKTIITTLKEALILIQKKMS